MSFRKKQPSCHDVDGHGAGHIDWCAVILDEEFNKKLKKMAKKRYGNTAFAEKAFAFAESALLSPEYRDEKLAAYTGKSSPQAFLCVCFRNLVTDYARKKFGRPRPPAWLKRLGPFWVRIFTLLCLQRRHPEDILLRVGARNGNGDGDGDGNRDGVGNGDEDGNAARNGDVQRDPRMVEEMINVIRNRVTDCGRSVSEEPHDFTESEPMTDDPDRYPAFAVEERRESEAIGQVLQALAALLYEDDPNRFPETLAQLREKAASFRLRLDAGERLMLRMVYEDGLKIAEVARRLDKPEHTVRRSVKKSVKALREQLQEAGLKIHSVA